MSPKRQTDWNPETYGRFRDFRLRPALDLLGRIGHLPPGDVIDLGCGAGAVASALRSRFHDHRLIGVDTSPAMLETADDTGAYDALQRDDIADWVPETPPALIYSNAALHWLDDHATLLPRLAQTLVPGGTLAVQMPAQHFAPSHRLLRETAEALFPDRFDFSSWVPAVAPPEDYVRLLAPWGDVDAWETRYIQRLPASDDAHPVRRFTESTAMRPILEKLTSDEAADFISAYEAALADDYPAEDDGSVLFPFKRLFFTLVR